MDNVLISDSMGVPLHSDFYLSISKSGNKHKAQFTDYVFKKILCVEGSTPQITHARMLQVILSYYYNNMTPLPKWATVKDLK